MEKDSSKCDAYSSKIVHGFLDKLARSLALASRYDNGFRYEDISNGICHGFSEILKENQSRTSRQEKEYLELKEYFSTCYKSYLNTLK